VVNIRAFTVETPRRGVSTEFMIVSKAIDKTIRAQFYDARKRIG